MISEIIDILEEYFDNYDEIAMQEKFVEIANKISKIACPKEFTEWIRTSNTLNSKLNDWICDRISTDDLYEYWKNLNNKK